MICLAHSYPVVGQDTAIGETAILPTPPLHPYWKRLPTGDGGGRSRMTASPAGRQDTAAGGIYAQLAMLAPGETVILLHPPLPLVGVSIAMERERQQNDSLVNG